MLLHTPMAFYISSSALLYTPGEFSLYNTIEMSSPYEATSCPPPNIFSNILILKNQFLTFCHLCFIVLCVSACAPFFSLNYLRVVCDTNFSCWEKGITAECFWDCFWNVRKTPVYHQLLSNSIIPLYSFNISAVCLRTKIFFHNIVIEFWIFNTGKVLLSNLQCISNFVTIPIKSFRVIPHPPQYKIQSELHLALMFLLSLNPQ